MGKIPNRIAKRLETWKNSKQDVPKEELHSVLNFFFGNQWSYGEKGTGSHNFKISHEKFKGHSDYGPDGNMTIPVTGGQRVKHWYLKNLLKAIEIIQEGDES